MSEKKISGVYILLTPVACGVGYEYRVSPLTEDEVDNLFEWEWESLKSPKEAGSPTTIWNCYNKSKVFQDIADAKKEGMTVLNALFLANGEYAEHGVMIIEFPYTFEYYREQCISSNNGDNDEKNAM